MSPEMEMILIIALASGNVVQLVLGRLLRQELLSRKSKTAASCTRWTRICKCRILTCKPIVRHSAVHSNPQKSHLFSSVKRKLELSL